ncbi:MAG: MFS transporter, partial [Pseudomonadota bacterium]
MSKKSQRSPLLIAFFTIFLDLLGFGIVIPVNSFYVQSLGASPAVIAWLSASYSLMQFLFAPFWGRLSDKIGRRPVILISVAASCAGHMIFGLSSTLFTVFAARLLAGFGNANLGTAQAIISDVTTPENRAKGMGLIGAAFGLGFLLGPAIGGFAGQYSPQAPAIVAGCLAFINFMLAYFLLPETR